MVGVVRSFVVDLFLVVVRFVFVDMVRVVLCLYTSVGLFVGQFGHSSR